MMHGDLIISTDLLPHGLPCLHDWGDEDQHGGFVSATMDNFFRMRLQPPFSLSISVRPRVDIPIINGN